MTGPTKSAATSTFSQSGNSTIDPLLSDGFQKWGGARGTGANLSFSFPWTSNNDASWQQPKYSTDDEPHATYHFGFNATQMQAARNVLQAWSNVANLSFMEVTETSTDVGDYRFGFSSAVDGYENGAVWGWSVQPSNYWAIAADVWVDTSHASETDWSAGSYNYEALMHEIGHGLGFKHPGSYRAGGGSTPGPYLSSDLDNSLYTIMSYNDPARHYWDAIKKTSVRVDPETPMVYDIQAMQYLYGANTSYHTGNDVYTFDPKDPFYKTIWDAGGTDTIDVSNFNLGCWVNLTPGSYSDIGISYARPTWDTTNFYDYDGTNALGIAFGATIENVIGGQGNDYLEGNDASNSLYGGNGDDTLYGLAGDDTLYGGAGNDLFYLSDGSDTLDGGTGTDKIILTYNQSAYTVSQVNGAWHVQGNASHPNPDFQGSLYNIERITFADGTLGLDTNGNSGIMYRLYKAAFDRAPDAPGLGWNIHLVDTGMTQGQMADAFVHSAEFTNKYGVSLSNAEFINQLYLNVLDRTPDALGLAWNLNLLNTTLTRADMLNGFSDSAENQTNVIGQTQDGIWFT